MGRELLAGAILVLLVRGPWVAPEWRQSLLGRAAIIVGVNALYEGFLDDRRGQSGHQPWADVGQRLAGSAGVEIIFRVTR